MGFCRVDEMDSSKAGDELMLRLLNREIVVFRKIVVFDFHFHCEMAMLRACALGNADVFCGRTWCSHEPLA